MGMTYSETFILTGLLGALVLVVLYRLTLKPLRQLNEDMDQVLKGDLSQVTHEFKFEELDPLWDLINSALQRVPKGSSGIGGSLGSVGPTAEELAGPFRMFGETAVFPVLVCDGDKRVMYMNTMFEDVSGIRSDNSIGQEISAVARDQSFAQFVNDLFDRAVAGTEGVSEDTDFSGVSYKCRASCVGSGTSKCYVLAATRVEG
jgi:PAS domain-containing protein